MIRANGHSGNGAPGVQGHAGNGHDLVIAIEAHGAKNRQTPPSWLAETSSRVWSPQQIREAVVLEQVLAQMREPSGPGTPGGCPDKACAGDRSGNHVVIERTTGKTRRLADFQQPWW
jgi:hypothetical protein